MKPEYHSRGEVLRVSIATPAARAVGPDRTEAPRGVGGHPPDAGEPFLRRSGELELVPAAREVGAHAGELLPQGDRRRAVDPQVAEADGDRVEQEPMAGDALVQPLSPLLERREQHVRNGEAHAGADSGNVVEVVVKPLELEQQRARPPEIRLRPLTTGRFARLRVGDGVGDRVGRARALHVGQALGDLDTLGRALEATVLVEEPEVEVQDPLADDVETKVPGLNDPGMDRPDRHLVGIVAADRHRPLLEVGGMGDEGSHRVVPDKAPTVDVVRLTLVPLGRRDEVDEARQSRIRGAAAEQQFVRSPGQHQPQRLRGRVQAGEAPAGLQRR